MKKTLLIIGAVSAWTFAVGQDRTPQKGDIGVELNLNISNVINTIDFNTFTQGLKGRYFINENMAARVGLSFGSLKNTINFAEESQGTGGIAEVVRKTSYFLFTPGFEYHIGDYDKVSPYVGADLVLGLENKSESRINTDGDVAGGLVDTEFTQDDEVTVENGHLLFDGVANVFVPEKNTIGIRFITGVDYFFTEKLFIGAEFGFGVNNQKEKDLEVTAKDDSANNTETLVELGDKISEFGFQVNGGIRIGWFF